MRQSALFATSMGLLIIGQGFAEDPATKPTTRVVAPPQHKTQVTVSTTGDSQVRPAGQAARPRDEQSAADERAIRATADAYVKAFNAGDAKAAAAQFTDDAEYIDAQGIAYDGRKVIEDLLTAFFANYPERKIELAIDSLRFVTPGVAIEDGVTTVTTAKDSQPVVYHYTAVHVKNSAKWQTASVRDRASNSRRQHKSQLQQLEWLLGDWVHEGDDAVVHFTCRPVDSGNFFERKFTVHVAGQETMTGLQRIGWDAQAGKFRAWVFDSDGGYAEGFWHHDDNGWILKLAGVTPDGESASSTSIYTFVDARTMTFRSVDHEVAGVQLPDSSPLKIVRKFPQTTTSK